MEKTNKCNISVPASREQVKSAIDTVGLITSIMAQDKTPSIEQYGILFDEVSKVLNGQVIIGGATSAIYDYTEAISYQEGVCPPNNLACYIVHAKSLLADLMAVIDENHLKADAVGIMRKVSEINASLSLAEKFFEKVTSNGLED